MRRGDGPIPATASGASRPMARPATRGQRIPCGTASIPARRAARAEPVGREQVHHGNGPYSQGVTPGAVGGGGPTHTKGRRANLRHDSSDQAGALSASGSSPRAPARSWHPPERAGRDHRARREGPGRGGFGRTRFFISSRAGPRLERTAARRHPGTGRLFGEWPCSTGRTFGQRDRGD